MESIKPITPVLTSLSTASMSSPSTNSAQRVATVRYTPSQLEIVSQSLSEARSNLAQAEQEHSTQEKLYASLLQCPSAPDITSDIRDKPNVNELRHLRAALLLLTDEISRHKLHVAALVCRHDDLERLRVAREVEAQERLSILRETWLGTRCTAWQWSEEVERLLKGEMESGEPNVGGEGGESDEEEVLRTARRRKRKAWANEERAFARYIDAMNSFRLQGIVDKSCDTAQLEEEIGSLSLG